MSRKDFLWIIYLAISVLIIGFVEMVKIVHLVIQMMKSSYVVLVHNGVHDLEQFPTRFPDLEEDKVREYLEGWFLGCNDGASFTVFCYEDVFDKETGEQMNDETGEVRE